MSKIGDVIEITNSGDKDVLFTQFDLIDMQKMKSAQKEIDNLTDMLMRILGMISSIQLYNTIAKADGNILRDQNICIYELDKDIQEWYAAQKEKK